MTGGTTLTGGARRTGDRTSDSPAVSVVMPAYNHEKFIIPAVESVRDQSFKNWELLIVDDGSTDETGSKADGLSGGPIRVFHQENSGTASALNRGLAEARGQYIAILNSDDAYHPKRFERLIEAMNGNPGALLALSTVRLIDGQGEQIVAGREVKWLAAAREFYRNSGNFFLSVLRDNFTCTSSNFLFRRELLDRIGPFRDFRYANDLDFLFRALSIAPPVFADEELLSYRIHEANTLRERKRKRKKEFLLELAWIVAVQLEKRRIYEIAAPRDIFAVLDATYGLRMEAILFCLMELRRNNGNAEILFTDREMRADCLRVIDRTLERNRFISNLHAGGRKLLSDNKKLLNENKKIFELLQKRDGECLLLSEKA
ncbi:MAG: glycosyltransferase, partial [Deltaproteobacteria bacterium]|nr:glycosyltransferase [Deltaproteobacteria bacterium]